MFLIQNFVGIQNQEFLFDLIYDYYSFIIVIYLFIYLFICDYYLLFSLFFFFLKNKNQEITIQKLINQDIVIFHSFFIKLSKIWFSNRYKAIKKFKNLFILYLYIISIFKKMFRVKNLK